MASNDLPAFPQSTKADGPFGGMSLRDWFAGQALMGFVAASGHDETGIQLRRGARDAGVSVAEFMAVCAYNAADAMLAAREGRD